MKSEIKLTYSEYTELLKYEDAFNNKDTIIIRTDSAYGVGYTTIKIATKDEALKELNKEYNWLKEVITTLEGEAEIKDKLILELKELMKEHEPVKRKRYWFW